MIYETMETIFVTGRVAAERDLRQRLADQRMSWSLQASLGVVLLAIGATLLHLTFGRTIIIFTVILPSLILILGFLMIVKGIRERDHREHAGQEVFCGGVLAVTGLVLFIFWEIYLVLIFLALMIWFLSSVAVTLLRVVREHRKPTKGFGYTLGLGAGSLALGVLAITLPVGLIDLLLILLAGLVLMAGAFTLLDAWGLRNAARLMEADEGLLLSAPHA